MSKIPLVFTTQEEATARRLADAEVLAVASRRFVELRRALDEYLALPSGTVVEFTNGITSKEHLEESVWYAEYQLRDALVKWELFECTVCDSEVKP